MPIEPRLIVTGHNDDGDAVFVEDRHPEPVRVQALPGADFYLLWGTPDGVATVGERDAAPILRPYFPGLGGSRALFLRWAPHADEPSTGDHSEVEEKLPGLLDPFEEGGDGMHTTDTVDYAICLEGELSLTLDHGAEVTLTPGTCVVQLGTRHAWKNKSDQPALMCYVQIGAVRA
ncbi:cupin domain-containing protein [Cryptosporangium sp. NPDC048952]|uniref:cupin domain-containing protein n=1 Tax=Cryptosporangium sp. NPDC048952 TaxID=3363961 RepID=UPI00371747D0